jgi:hypothetical protein
MESINICAKEDAGIRSPGHFEEADDTTKRLVNRCRTVTWLCDGQATTTSASADKTTATPVEAPPTASSERIAPMPPVPRKLRKRNGSEPMAGFLTPQLDLARESALSVVEVAAQREKPGVMTPSRKCSVLGAATKKEKPPPPRTRRSAWSRNKKEAVVSSLSGSGSAQHSSDMHLAKTEQPDLPTLNDDVHQFAAAPTPIQDSVHPHAVKKPPPAPKTRRWHGKLRRKDNELRECEGQETSTPSLEMKRVGQESGQTRQEPAASESGTSSVTEALSMDRTEAMDSLSRAVENVTLTGSTATSPPEVRIVLAPPSPAPPRGVPGPMFSVEKSPFVAEDEDGDGDGDGEDDDDDDDDNGGDDDAVY